MKLVDLGSHSVSSLNLIFRGVYNSTTSRTPNGDLKSNIRFVLASYFNSENPELAKVVHSKLTKIFAQPHNGV